MAGSDGKVADLGKALGLSSSVTVVAKKMSADERRLQKAEEALLQSKGLSVDDSGFDQLPVSVREAIVKPTYDPIQLSVLTHQNNTLLQCISTMEVNIDGTGFSIERADGKPMHEAKEKAPEGTEMVEKSDSPEEEDPPEVKAIKEFFAEPFPGESFTTQRRQLRRDLEGTGNAYLEVIRNQKKEITFLRRLDAKLTRLLRYDGPVQVERSVIRGGKVQSLKMLDRERRFAMIVGTKVVYFREFNSSRQLNATTGEWVDPNATAPTPAAQLATEVIHLKVMDDVATAYGVPRWINQVPSVLGSRKAEEFNLEYFAHGGMPPAIIMVQGGQLSTESRAALTSYLAGTAKLKQRGVIAEIFPSSGDLSSSGNVKVTVERFGNEQQKDSMFQNYDVRCAEHVRGAFRLPPLFLGLTKDHNYATAYASYMVAEAQVFKPERDEFDEIINVKLMRAMAPGYVYRSIPLTVNDIEQKVKAMQLVKDVVERESLVDTLNELIGTNLQAKEEGDPLAIQTLSQSLAGGAKVSQVETDEEGNIVKMEDAILTELAVDWSKHLSGEKAYDDDAVAVMKQLIKTLSGPTRKLFNSYVALRVANPTHDTSGVASLLEAAGTCGDGCGHN